MEMLSNTYGWTPRQIRDMDIKDVQNYVDIISTRRQIEAAKAKRN